jgi:hypothetical protein
MSWMQPGLLPQVFGLINPPKWLEKGCKFRKFDQFERFS